MGKQMTHVKRREREKQELVDRILDAARKLFADQGYEAVSMRKIAQSIDYTATTLYSYFEDKEALFYALCQREWAAFGAQLAAWSTSQDPLERLRAQCGMYIRFAAENPHYFRFLFMTPLPSFRNKKENYLEQPGRDSYAISVKLLAQAIEQNRLDPSFKDADLAGQTLWAAVHGVAALEVIEHHKEWVPLRPLEARKEAMLDTIMRGLLRSDK